MKCEIIGQTYDGKEQEIAINTGFIIEHTRAEKHFLDEHPIAVPNIHRPTSQIKDSPPTTIISIQFKVDRDNFAEACKEIIAELLKARDQLITNYNANKEFIGIRDEIFGLQDNLEEQKKKLTEWTDRVEIHIGGLTGILNAILQACKKRKWGEFDGVEYLSSFQKGELWNTETKNHGNKSLNEY